VHWLNEVPFALVVAFLAMMPKLAAEESIKSTTEGTLSKAFKVGQPQKSLWNTWGRLARSSPGESPKRTPMTAESLQAMGIAVKVVKSGRR